MTVIIESSDVDDEGKITINFYDGNVITFRSESELKAYVLSGSRDDEEILIALKHVLESQGKNISSPIKIERSEAAITDVATGVAINVITDKLAATNGE
jgi:hypothetical protein